MNKTLAILLLGVWFSLFPSGWIRVYNLDGTEVKLEDNTTHLIICYSPASCHECVNDIILFCRNIASTSENCKCSVLINGEDPMRMHMETSLLEEYLTDTSDVRILYDSNPKKKKRIFHRKRIQHTPSLLIVDSEKHDHFYSYESLFGDNQGFSKCFDEIKRLIEVDVK
ncbi:MAG: hypothetical protein K6F14_05075 [Clostridiales bacterium]|nr:hypothetical protein [Clostridiales bacterium]